MKTFLAALCLGGLVLPLVLEATLGCTLLLDGGEAVGDFADNTYTCRCVCTARMLDTGEVDYPVCMTPELNPNLDPGMGTDPSAAELEADCEARVQANIQAMGSFCRVGPMLTCDCAVAATTQYVESCDDPCLERPLLNRTRCEDFALEEAFANFTNTEGLDPVCLSGGEEPVPLGTALFGGLSTCDVSGDATVDVDDKSKTVDAVGSVAFDGGPCPGQSCDVGMIYRLDMDSIEFSGLFGLGKVRVEDLLAAGGTAAAAASVDSLGQGSFPPQAARSSGQGTRRNFFAGVETGSESGTVAISNPEPIAVRVNWQGRTCAVEGALSGATVEGESALGVSMDLFGILVNQPPSADAGDDRAVECTSPQDTTVDLDGSGSEDPDANIVFATWFRGGRLGDEIGSELGVEVGQGLGVAEIYYLKVVDAFLQGSEDSAVVLVVDTTAPDLTAPQDVALECTGAQTPVALGDPIYGDLCDDSVDLTNDAPAAFPVGQTVVTWSATDDAGNTSTAVQVVTVQDTTAPTLSLALDPSLLWPPNHHLTPVGATPEATDVCDPDPAIRLVSIASSEPDDASGDGNTAGDVQGAAFGSDDREFELRAERQGGGSGRVYTVRYETADASGNAASSEAAVSVPRSKGKKK